MSISISIIFFLTILIVLIIIIILKFPNIVLSNNETETLPGSPRRKPSRNNGKPMETKPQPSYQPGPSYQARWSDSNCEAPNPQSVNSLPKLPGEYPDAVFMKAFPLLYSCPKQREKTHMASYHRAI